MTATQRALLNALRLALAGVAMGLAAGPFFLSDTQLSVLADFFSMLVLAILWNLLAGYADIVTIGQHAFVGVGAYAFYAFAALAGVDPYLSIPLAGVVALIIAVPTMALLFRLRTAYFSIGTWVVAEVMMLGAGKIEAFGGGSGISVPIEILRAFGSTRSGRLATIYWLGFVLAAFALGSTYLLLRSRFGVGLMAMRENEESAASVGVNVARAHSLLSRGCARAGNYGRSHYIAKTEDCAPSLLQHRRLVNPHHFHCRHWRHRHNRGARSGDNFFLCFARILVRSRDVALDLTRYLFDRNYPHRPARYLGACSSFCAARRPHSDSASIVLGKHGSGEASAP
jgi:hypothetical protein